MKLRHIAALAALTLVSGALGQTLTLTNLKGPVAKACKTTEAKTIAALWDQLAKCNQAAPVPTPTPSPTPAPTGKPLLLYIGDSLSPLWAGNHSGIVAKAHPEFEVQSDAIGGSGIPSGDRLAADLAKRPQIVFLFFGANDLTAYPSGADYAAAMFKVADAFRAVGAKVILGTITPQCNQAKQNQWRVATNAAYRANVGVRFDALADYATDPTIGADASACDKNVYSDGIHLWDQTAAGKVDGQSILASFDEKALTALAAPMPMPTPTPAPTPTGTGELAPIASGIDVASLLSPAWGTGDIPGPNDGGAEGAFRFLCAPSHNSYNDPIVYPGQPGKSHLHTFFGNTLADANSTYASLRTTGDSTCNNALNRSAYWVPAMMTPAGKVVMPYQIGIYYKRVPQGSPYCAPPYATACLAIPRGLRYVFGYNMTDASKNDPDRFRWFNCDGVGAVSGHFATIKEAAVGCPAGASLMMLLVSPNCWNGKDLDSADHRSHMAYQYYDGQHGAPVCPSTHPYLIPFFEVAPIYLNDGTAADWKLSSDIQMGTAGGITAHADWFGAWEDSVKDMWTANCIDKALTCSGGDLGNGKQMTTLFGYSYQAVTTLVNPPARPVM